MTHQFGYFIESMVSILLLLTILYCVRLNKQLRLLKADEQSLRATISELITATEIAERAIAGLKQTMREGEQGLSSRIQKSEQLAAEIDKQMKAGEQLLSKLARIAAAARPAEPPPAPPAPPVAPDAKAVAAAAQAFTERARARLSGLAA
jgi:chromosome segregation ATPase